MTIITKKSNVKNSVLFITTECVVFFSSTEVDCETICGLEWAAAHPEKKRKRIATPASPNTTHYNPSIRHGRISNNDARSIATERKEIIDYWIKTGRKKQNRLTKKQNKSY